MVIDKGLLIALLVEKTGWPKEEVEKQLNQFTARILEAIKSDRQFHIEEFGTFSMENGMIQFKPEEQLQTEINQKYAGMKPIELMAAFKETGTGVPVEESLPKQPKKEKVQEKPKPAPKKTPQKESTPIKRKQKKPVAAAASAVGKPEGKSLRIKDRPRKKRTPILQDTDTLGMILVTTVVVIAVSVGGWLLYDSWNMSRSRISNSTTSTAEDTSAQRVDGPIATGTVDDSNATAGTVADTAEQNSSSDVSESRAGEEQGASALYGLKGERNADANNGYTIVIHSFRLRSSIQGIADSLSRRGYRTLLKQSTVNGENWWRLGLGQFETIADAQAAAQELSAQYRENHFIKRI